MPIQVGDRLPEATLRTPTAEGPATKSTADLFAGRKVVLFAVPGAYTPTCTRNHMPGFVDKADAIKAKGISEIYCLAVNDVHVMKAWGESLNAMGKVVVLSDGNADFTKAIGMDIDLAAGGLGIRSKRFSMIVDDGVVKALNIEESPGKAEVSGADALLAQL